MKTSRTWRAISSHKLQRKKEKHCYPRLFPPESKRKRSMRSASWRKVNAFFRGAMQACSHTSVVLLSIVRMQVLAAVPLLFTALHMYSPSSSGKVSGR